MAERHMGGAIVKDRRKSKDAPAPIQRGPGYGTGCVHDHLWHRASDRGCFLCGMPKSPTANRSEP
jgi:hypothetical protein